MSSKIPTDILGNTVADFANHSADDILEFIESQHKVASSAYRKCANAIVAAVEKIGEAKVKAALKKRGFSDSDVKNAFQLVRVYDAVVKAGKADQEWFNGVNYMNAVHLNAALKKVTVDELAEKNLFEGKAANWIEIEMVAESGLFKAERIEAAEKDAKRKAEKAKRDAEEAAGGEASEGGEEGKKTSTTTKTETAKTPREEFDHAADKTQAIALALITSGDEVAAEAVCQRIDAMRATVIAAIAAKKQPDKKAANA